MTDSKDKLICVAAIAGAFGVRGEVKIKSFTDEPSACLSYGPLYKDDGTVILTLISHRKTGKFFAVRCEEIETREQAEVLKSTKLYVPRLSLPLLDEDNFYYEDLVGLKAVSEAGEVAGKIIAVHEFGAGDMLEVKPDKGPSFFQPFTKLAVPKVDLMAGIVTIILAEEDSEGAS